MAEEVGKEIALCGAVLLSGGTTGDDGGIVNSEDLFNKQLMTRRSLEMVSRIAYVEPIMDRNTNKYNSHISTVSTLGQAEPQPLTFGTELDFAPRWSPDGKYMAFVSTR